MDDYNAVIICFAIVIAVLRFYLLSKRDSDYDDEKITKREKEMLDKIKRDIDLKKGMAQAGDENFFQEFYVTKQGNSGGGAYVQNNTKAIVDEISVLTPSFNAQKFLGFAKDVFRKAVDENQRQMLIGSLISNKIDLTQLPEDILRFDVCFLHNYIVEGDYESIKLLISVDTNETATFGMAERYFATFRRKNPLFKTTKGQAIAVNCPHCGAELEFKNRAYMVCPYCDSTVTFAEYDWMLSKVERITDNTLVTNVGVIKK